MADWSARDWSGQNWQEWSEQDWQEWSERDWSSSSWQKKAADGDKQAAVSGQQDSSKGDSKGQDPQDQDKKPGAGTKNDWSHKKRQLNFFHTKDMDALKLEHKQQMTELQQRHDEVLKQKQKDLDTIDQAFRDYAYDYAKTRCQLDILLDRETEHQGEIEELENHLTEAYEENRELKSSLATTQSEMKELKNKIAEHEEQSKQHEENKQLKEFLAKAESEKKELKEKAADYEEQIKKLNGQMAETNGENIRKRKQVAALMDQVTEVNEFIVGYHKKHHLEKFTRPSQERIAATLEPVPKKTKDRIAS
ncbi:unnamed protein product [Symbiodinium sp. KB8]|nr:unnamed protein product [Symbiodinium sp. KB8]